MATFRSDPSSPLLEEKRQLGPREGPWVILVAAAGGSGHKIPLWPYGVVISKQRCINRVEIRPQKATLLIGWSLAVGTRARRYASWG